MFEIYSIMQREEVKFGITFKTNLIYFDKLDAHILVTRPCLSMLP